MSSPVLAVKNLTKIFYGKRRFFFLRSKEPPFMAVNNLSFHLQEGEILGILGPNGAGKTTTIEMLLGTLEPTSGNISYFGKEFYKNRSEILDQVTHASAYMKLPASLTIQENLEIVGRLYGMSLNSIRRRIDRLLEQFGMEEFRGRQAGALSAGQMTRVMLVKAFLPKPKIVLLDEPTASLDPDIALEARAFILKQQREFKVSVILTSHNMREVAEICDRALVLQRGTIIQEDVPEKLAKSVALNEVSFKILQNQEKALSLLQEKKWHYSLQGSEINVEIDEALIPQLLKGLVLSGVDFSHFEIIKPTLEDYFLYIVREEEI